MWEILNLSSELLKLYRGDVIKIQCRTGKGSQRSGLPAYLYKDRWSPRFLRISTCFDSRIDKCQSRARLLSPFPPPFFFSFSFFSLCRSVALTVGHSSPPSLPAKKNLPSLVMYGFLHLFFFFFFLR